MTRGRGGNSDGATRTTTNYHLYINYISIIIIAGGIRYFKWETQLLGFNIMSVQPRAMWFSDPSLILSNDS